MRVKKMILIFCVRLMYHAYEMMMINYTESLVD